MQKHSLDNFVTELLILSKHFTVDNIKNRAKVDTLIEILLEKENISKTYFDQKYKENLAKSHLDFFKRIRDDAVEELEKDDNETIAELFEQLSKEEKENIIKKYL